MSNDADPTTTSAAAAAEALDRHGIDTVFCLPGEETIALIEAIDDAGIDLVVARHEQHAGFMAATHGRLTGRPGVVVTTLGPGMTNATTALAHATLGGYPVLHLAGQKPMRGNWEGSFQVVDLVAAASPMTKSAVRCTDPAEVATTVIDGLRTAVTGRPGAVFVEVPTDVARGSVTPGTPRPVPPPPVPIAPPGQLEAAAGVLERAERPIVLLGGASHQVSASLVAFADETRIPVVPLQTGIGALAADHPCALPSLGMHGDDAADLALIDADVVVAVGYHPTEHPPQAWNRSDADIVHLAPWPAPVRPSYRPVVELVGDMADALDRLAQATPPRNDRRAQELANAVRSQLASEPRGTDGDGIATRDVVDAVRAAVPRDGIVALDNGSYKLWFARHYEAFRPHGLLLDNALATMGAGLATASEAARLDRERPVVAVVGDGGFLMNVGDLETAVRLGLDNLTVVVLRDDAYGFIADHQRERGARRVAVDLGNPDLVALAASFGIEGVHVGGRDDLDAALTEAVSRSGPTLVDCRLDGRADETLHEIDSLAGARRRHAG